ncbi:MAG TPA: non-heme iron oxygenase ferredoxin subunit [Mycobacteriales bacterium]|jgi:Ferredoxin subunits of nitrite reductase and ring-hydroxylating dioxygenases
MTVGRGSGGGTEFVSACRLAEVPETGAIRVELSGIPVAVVRSEGEVYAIYDVCSHQEVPLSEGEVEGSTIECWLHGSRFDLRTGKPTVPPATRPVPVYPVRIEGNGDDAVVFVRLNEEK